MILLKIVPTSPPKNDSDILQQEISDQKTNDATNMPEPNLHKEEEIEYIITGRKILCAW